MKPALVGNILILIATIEAIVFVVMYHNLATWWKSEAGRHLMIFGLTMAAILIMLNLRTLLDVGSSCGLETWQENVVFAWLPVVLGWRIRMLIKAQSGSK